MRRGACTAAAELTTPDPTHDTPADRGTGHAVVGRGRLRRVARRLAKGVALLLVGVAVLYLVGVNVFLRTHLFRDAIGADPESLLVDYGSAYSVWPGSIHAEGLVIRGSDSSVQWILRIQRVDFQVSFTDLARKKFHADHVRADGVSMRLRRRVDVVTPETMSALPSIPGFLDPPLAAVGPPPPPITDANYRLWSVRLEDVIASRVREVWVDTVRYSGDLEVRGRWKLTPLRWLEVGPATVDAHPLDVSFGMVESWVSGAVGRLEVTVHRFNVETVPGEEIIDQVSVRGDLSGVAHVANVVNRAMEGDGVEITHAEAPFELRANLDHGVLRRGTQVRTEPFDARALAAGLVLEASLQADVRVDDDDVGYVDLRVATARVSASDQPRARAASIAATFASRDLDLAAHLFSAPVYAVEVDGAETDSLAYWRSRLPMPPEIRVVSGSATASGRLEGLLREKTGKGHVTFGVRDLAVAKGDARVQGNATGVLHVDGSLDRARVDLSGSEVSLREVHATARAVTIDVPSLQARARALVVAVSGVTGHVSVDAPVIQLPSLSAVGALLSLPADIAIEGGRATARVRMDVDLVKLVGDGEVALAAHNLRLRLGAERMQGELTVALRAKPNGAMTDLSGSQLAFRSDGAAGTLDWWGRMRLHQASFGVRPGLRFRSDVTAAAKDGSPLTALVADNTALPQWLIDAVSTKGLEATGELLVTPSVFALRSVEAHAQGADVGFEFGKIRMQTKEWALLLDLGVALAGVDVTDGQTQVLLFGARPWFHAKVASLEAVERRSE